MNDYKSCRIDVFLPLKSMGELTTKFNMLRSLIRAWQLDECHGTDSWSVCIAHSILAASLCMYRLNLKSVKVFHCCAADLLFRR